MKRKNDQQRKGYHPRLGRSEDPALDVVHQLKVYLDAAGLGLGYQCRKRQTPHACCKVCPPLFPRSRRAAGGGWELCDIVSSPSGFSDMIPLALKQIGMDASGFSGVCARRGGITTAIEAHVPEHVLWMQSGHAQTRAARQYVVLSSMIRSCCFRLSRPSDCKVEAILVPTGPGMDWMVNVYSWYIVGKEIVHSWDIFGIWLRSVAIGADSRVRRNGRWSNHSCWS
jgi:hypothetical protein